MPLVIPEIRFITPQRKTAWTICNKIIYLAVITHKCTLPYFYYTLKKERKKWERWQKDNLGTHLFACFQPLDSESLKAETEHYSFLILRPTQAFNNQDSKLWRDVLWYQTIGFNILFCSILESPFLYPANIKHLPWSRHCYTAWDTNKNSYPS